MSSVVSISEFGFKWLQIPGSLRATLDDARCGKEMQWHRPGSRHWDDSWKQPLKHHGRHGTHGCSPLGPRAGASCALPRRVKAHCNPDSDIETTDDTDEHGGKRKTLGKIFSAPPRRHSFASVPIRAIRGSDFGFRVEKSGAVVGFEPTTDGLQNRCSTPELNWPARRAP